MKTVLIDVPRGRCVRYQGRWGVTCGASRVLRIVDFWDGGRELIPAWKVVFVGKAGP